jgi:hypothetical protein
MTNITPEKIQFMKDLLNSLKEEFDSLRVPDLQLEQKMSYGIVDKFLFDKCKADRNGYHANYRLITVSFSELKDLIKYVVDKKNITGKTIIVYQKVSNDFHFKYIRSIDPKHKNFEKYLALL